MNKREDVDFKEDIKALLKKLHKLEAKLDQLPQFSSTKGSGSRETSHDIRHPQKSRPNHPLSQVFSGINLKKTKSIKRGFITWPSEDDKPLTPTDRVSYVINRWESKMSNGKNDDLFSEPSDFVDLCTSGFSGDRRKDSNLSGSVSIKESNACVISKIKNSELKS